MPGSTTASNHTAAEDTCNNDGTSTERQDPTHFSGIEQNGETDDDHQRFVPYNFSTNDTNMNNNNGNSNPSEVRRRRTSPVPTGLSALIMAATAQLGHLADVASMKETDEIRYSTDSTRRIQSKGATAAMVGRSIESDAYSSYVRTLPSSSVNTDRGTFATSRTTFAHPRVPIQKEQTPVIVPESHTKHSSFPEVLMSLALDPDNAEVITFLPDGKFFAIQSTKFVDEHFLSFFSPPIKTFEDFLGFITEWGFSIIMDPSSTGVSVFRHPNFIKGEWEKCAVIRYGVSPTKARLDALPDRSRIEYTLSDDSIIGAQHYSLNNNHSVESATHSMDVSHNSTKRRLSPGFLARRESISSVSSQKQKVEATAGIGDEAMNLNTVSFAEPQHVHDTSGDESEIGIRDGERGHYRRPSGHSEPSINSEDAARSLSLSQTVERMKIKQSSRRNSLASISSVEVTNDGKLVDQAVTSATQTIVWDAIETLLRDEPHTRETYVKHEKELSKSIIPGIIPISTQLFSPSESERQPVIERDEIFNDGSFSYQTVPSPHEQPVSSSTLPYNQLQQNPSHIGTKPN